jgi:Tfp pilus assembly major pilin PilA
MKFRMGKEGSIKSFFWMAVFIAIIFVAISFGKPYYRFNTLRSHTKDTLMADLGGADIIKKKIMEDAAELKVPLDEENLEVVVTPTKITKVKATWSETVDFWGYYQKKLDFIMETEY